MARRPPMLSYLHIECQIKDVSIFNKTLKYIRPRFTGVFLSALACCVPVYVLTWYFYLFEDLYVSITMSLLVAAVPVTELLSPPRSWKLRGDLFGILLFFVIANLLVAGDKYNWYVLRTNAAIALVFPPGGWLLWKLIGRNWLLLTALTLALAVMMIYWIAALLETGGQLALLLLLPLPFGIFIGVLWAPLAMWVWKAAKERKYRRVSGPGMQAVAMVFLFLPAILTAFFVPGMLELSQAWSTVSLAIAGILLSAVVSEPLRRFLLELGNLSPEPYGSTEQPQGNSGREE